MAVKLPTESVVVEATVVPSKVMVTIEIGANPLPVTFTEVGDNTGPVSGAIEITGVPLAVVNCH